MVLIASTRPTREDLRVWAERERMDDAYIAASGAHLRRLADAAVSEIRRFVAAGPCYLGVSWGKDSLVVAHLAAAAAIDIPFVWVRVKPIENPDCETVRDAFRWHRTIRYHEATVWCQRDPDGWHATGTLEAGFSEAARIAGTARYVSGIRGAESGARKMRVMAHGLSTARTCAAIGRWTGADVFAYLRMHDLPIHPAYACSLGGTLDRERIRVSSIGGRRGSGKGRGQWEQRYYGDALRAIDAMTSGAPYEAPDPRGPQAKKRGRP